MGKRKLGLIGLAASSGIAGLVGAVAIAATGQNVTLTSVPVNQPKVVGTAQPNALALELQERIVAQGSLRLENGTPAVPAYGYDGDGPELPVPGDLPSATHK